MGLSTIEQRREIYLRSLASASGSGGSALIADKRTYLVGVSAGALIATLIDPYGAGSTYSVVGAAPSTLALSNGRIVAGAGAQVEGASSTITIRATKGGRAIEEPLTFTAVVAPPPAPTPAPVPTPTPTPLARFTAPPSIAGERARLVGDIFAYDPGTVENGQLGEVLLLKDGVRNRTLAGGSGRFDAVGSYVVRSAIDGTNITSNSVAVTVSPAVVSPITPPTFRFPADRVAGTNPPVIVWDDPDDTVLATDTLELTWVSNGATSTKQIPMDIASRSAHEFTVPEWNGLAAGSWSLSGEYLRTTDENGDTIPLARSGSGPKLEDTLSAKSLPAPTTVWTTNKSKSAVIDPNDATIVRGGGQNAQTPVVVNNARTDSRFAEFVILQDEPGQDQIFFGIVPADTVVDPNSYDAPAGFVFVDSYKGNMVTGDIFTMLITPTELILNKNGALHFKVNHNIASYKICVSIYMSTKLRLNTGQTPFSYAPAGNTYTRYN